MKLFVQSTSIVEIREMADAGFVDGVAVPLAMVMEANSMEELREELTEIGRAFAVPICVSVPVSAQVDVYREGRDLARGLDHCIVQVPFLEETVAPIRRLVADGVKVCATHVYTGAQAFLAAKVGATIVVINADQLEEQGDESAHVMAEIRTMFDRSDVECDLMVSGVHSATGFTQCLLAGATSVCVTPELLRKMMTNALTDRGIDKFFRDLSRRQMPWSH